MTNSDKNIFINGKKQIIEMLQFMNESEKQKLLENIRYKNPAMARELSEKSLSFRSLFSIDKDIFRRILSHTNPTIIGLALYLVDTKSQRTALQLMNRSDAEKAFHIMNQNLSSKKAECLKAQNKILDIAISISRRSNITL